MIGGIVLYKDCFILRVGLLRYRVLSPDGLFIWETFTRSGAHNLIDSYCSARCLLAEKRGY